MIILTQEQQMKNRALMHKMLDIVLNVNCIGSSEETGGLPNAFFEFSGHTGDLQIRLYEAGWSHNSHLSPQYFIFDTGEPIQEIDVQKFLDASRQVFVVKDRDMLQAEIGKARRQIQLEEERIHLMERVLYSMDTKATEAAAGLTNRQE